MFLGAWSWSGSAETNGVTDEAILLSHTNATPTVSLTTDFPQWTNAYVNTNLINLPNLQTNLPPFDEN